MHSQPLCDYVTIVQTSVLAGRNNKKEANWDRPLQEKEITENSPGGMKDRPLSVTMLPQPLSFASISSVQALPRNNRGRFPLISLFALITFLPIYPSTSVMTMTWRLLQKLEEAWGISPFSCVTSLFSFVHNAEADSLSSHNFFFCTRDWNSSCR